MPTVRISASFDPVRDADVLLWLNKRGNVSDAIRQAVRICIQVAREPTRADLEAKLDRLLEMMRNMRTVEVPAEETPAEGDEPAEARKGLDAMKKRFQSDG